MKGFLRERFLKRSAIALIVLLAALLVAPQAMAAYNVKKVFMRFSGTAGEALATGEAVCLKDADGYVYLADANDADLRPAVGVVGSKTASASGQTVEIVVVGVISGWSSLAENGSGYLSETAAAITQSAPSYAQIMGFAINTTDYMINCRSYFDTSAITSLGVLSGATPIILEGATADAHETTITPTDPTADRTVTLPDETGNVLLFANANTQDVSVVFEGASADAHETTVTVTDPTADNTVTLADGGGTVVLSSLATNAADAANAVTGASNGLVYEGATADAHETTVSSTDPTADNAITLPDDSGAVVFSPGGSTTSDADSLAIPVTHAYVAKTTGGDAEALTLANGENGQILTIDLDTDGGGTGTLTPATKSGFTSIAFEDAGDNATLLFVDDSVGWIVMGAAGVAAPPVIAD